VVFAHDGVSYIIDGSLLTRTGAVTVDYLTQGWHTGFEISSEFPIAGACAVGGSCGGCG
jgi:hypothetical protein